MPDETQRPCLVSSSEPAKLALVEPVPIPVKSVRDCVCASLTVSRRCNFKLNLRACLTLIVKVAL